MNRRGIGLEEANREGQAKVGQLLGGLGPCWGKSDDH